MNRDLDEIDVAILANIEKNPNASIRTIINPLLLERSESVLRTRIRYLELMGLIKTIHTKHEVLCMKVE